MIGIGHDRLLGSLLAIFSFIDFYGSFCIGHQFCYYFYYLWHGFSIWSDGFLICFSILLSTSIYVSYRIIYPLTFDCEKKV